MCFVILRRVQQEFIIVENVHWVLHSVAKHGIFNDQHPMLNDAELELGVPSSIPRRGDAATEEVGVQCGFRLRLSGLPPSLCETTARQDGRHAFATGCSCYD
jgi:hypothetical protein